MTVFIVFCLLFLAATVVSIEATVAYTREIVYCPGTIEAEGNLRLRLKQSWLRTHVAISGRTGRGKTSLLLKFLRQGTAQGQGWTFVTPHSDAAEDILDYCAAYGVDPSRLIVLKPTADTCFAIDPFADLPDPRKGAKRFPDQLAIIMHRLATMPMRMVFCVVDEMPMPFILKVSDVKDPWEEKGLVRSRTWKDAERQKYLGRVYAAHPFYFDPSAEPVADTADCRCGETLCACAEEENLLR